MHLGFVLFIGVGLFWPEKVVIPVKHASSKDWNHESFWFEPWGISGVHKGIDVFAVKGEALLSATDGVVIYRGLFGIDGKVIAVLGPKWRIHYYAHLESIEVSAGTFVRAGERIGSVGDSGNAKGKKAHLHYVVMSLIPYLWRWDLSTQGWKKIFYLNPSEILLANKQDGD